MASQIITVVLFTVFFSEALTLMCHKCNIPIETCTGKNCTSGSHCISDITYNASDIGIGNRDCTADVCVNWAINIGWYRRTFQCCSSDLCNNATDSNNGKRCYTCSGSDCSQIITCKGDATQCITATDHINITHKGCVSKSICENIDLVKFSPALKDIAKTDISCCDGNLCNSGQSLIQGTVLLVSVLSLIWLI